MDSPRVYYDNVIWCGLVNRDLDPTLNAVLALEQMHIEGRIEGVTSKVAHIEQQRTRNPEVLSELLRRRDEISIVKNDHRLLGFNSQDLGRYGFISYPLISDIVDEELFAQLKVIRLKDDHDVKHLMYAHANGCQFFVTLDWKDSCPTGWKWNVSAVECDSCRRLNSSQSYRPATRRLSRTARTTSRDHRRTRADLGPARMGKVPLV
jgi:hypothetical protein